MKKLLIASLALSSLSASAMSFKAQMQPLKLPLMISTSQPPKVKFTPPGEMSIGLQRMCGDGDVADFSNDHPDFDFVPQSTTQLDVIIGYWVVEEGADFVPNSNNFYPVGYRKSPIAESSSSVVYNGNFIPMNKSFSPGPNGVNIIATDIINLRNIAQRSMGSAKNYRIFAGASTCLNPTDSAALATPGTPGFTFTPSPVEIGHVLSHEDSSSSTAPGLVYEAEKAVSSLDTSTSSKVDKFAKDNDHVSYQIGMKGSTPDTIYKGGGTGYDATTQKPFEFNVGKSGGADIEAKASGAWSAFKDIANLDYPDLSALPPTATDADKLAEYKNKLNAASISSKLSASTSNELSYCASFNLNTNSNAPQYKWEAFPMNLSCKFLFKGSALVTAFSALYNPSSLPSQSVFEDLKRNLAARFYVAAVFEAVQKTMHADSGIKIERASCYNKPSGKPMIYSLVGSYPFQFQLSAKHWQVNPLSLTHHHPEPLFALSDFQRYFDSDKVGVFGQVLDPAAAQNIQAQDWGISFPVKDKSEWINNDVDSATFNSSPINIYFRIRSIGGSCPMFC